MSENKENSTTFDAMIAGVKIGGLTSMDHIKMIVCYIVANFENKITTQNIINSVDEGMIANHFETVDSIAKMIETGYIKENPDSTLKIGNLSTDVIEMIENDLPITIREKCIALCQKSVATETYKRDNLANIKELKNGFEVELRVIDVNTEYLNLKMFAPTLVQAETIKERFISDPTGFYKFLIEDLFK